MMKYNTPITVLRDTASNEQRIDMQAMVDRDKLFLPVTHGLLHPRNSLLRLGAMSKTQLLPWQSPTVKK